MVGINDAGRIEQVHFAIHFQQPVQKLEHYADRTKNVSMMFQVQILKELRALLEIHQKPGNGGNDSASGTDDSEDKHG